MRDAPHNYFNYVLNFSIIVIMLFLESIRLLFIVTNVQILGSCTLGLRLGECDGLTVFCQFGSLLSDEAINCDEILLCRTRWKSILGAQCPYVRKPEIFASSTRGLLANIMPCIIFSYTFKLLVSILGHLFYMFKACIYFIRPHGFYDRRF